MRIAGDAAHDTSFIEKSRGNFMELLSMTAQSCMHVEEHVIHTEHAAHDLESAVSQS